MPMRLYQTRNVAAGNRLYEIDPAELIDLEFRELPAQAFEIVAIYHSHPESPAYPSSTDVELAFWPDAVFLICSLADRDRPAPITNPKARGRPAAGTLPATNATTAGKIIAAPTPSKNDQPRIKIGRLGANAVVSEPRP